jgi:hypothetical protein
MMPFVAVEVAVAILLTAARAASVGDGELDINDGQFTVDGQTRFVVFVSYFDGVRRIRDRMDTSLLDADFAYLASKGVSGVRIFPNWQFREETLMRCDGGLRPPQLAKLKLFIDRAAVNAFVVDVSFTLDTVKDARGRQCLSAAAYKSALTSATGALTTTRNVLFDLQNEFDKNLPPADPAHPSGWTPEQWRDYLAHEILPAVKARDPKRLATVSWTSDADPSAVFSLVQDAGFDVLAYHHRGVNWEAKTVEYIDRFRELFSRRPPARPIYVQEPNRFPFDRDANRYAQAVAAARRAGAAAWTFHNSAVERSKPLSGTTPFRDLLEPGERLFLDRLASMLR